MKEIIVNSPKYDAETTNIGYFETEAQAAQAYNIKAIELHGEFANINVV